MRNKSWKNAASKHLMLIAAIGLAAPVQFVLVTPAVAAANNITPYLCKNYASSGVFSASEIGVCVGAQTTGYNYYVNGTGSFGGTVAEQCNYLLDIYPDYFYSQWDSFTQCLADNGGLAP